MPVLNLPVTTVESLWEHDRRWINRALALQQAEAFAQPIREQHEAKKAKERQEAARERERAAIREQKRALWRNRQQVAERAMTEAD